MDNCTREYLAVEIETSLSSKRIIRTLDSVIAGRDKHRDIRTDNSRGFTTKVLSCRARNTILRLKITQPGRPMRNGTIERLNRVYREAILNANIFNYICYSEKPPKNGSKNSTRNEDLTKPCRKGHPPNGENKLNLILTINISGKSGT